MPKTSFGQVDAKHDTGHDVDMIRRAWTETELTAVLSLYCQIPFGKMDRRNALVRSLAGRINRTPSAVALKLVNFASLDPTLKKRGIAGMSNTSKADESLWRKYFGKWGKLAKTWHDLRLTDVKDVVADMDIAPSDALLRIGVDRLATTKVRIGQVFFRNAVLSAYAGRCCITGIAEKSLLRASHIVPWSVNTKARLDPRNGLCLNALHDAAFDRGFLSVQSDMTICLSSQLRKKMPSDIYAQSFGRFENQRIDLPDRFGPLSEYLDYHRTEIFKS